MHQQLTVLGLELPHIQPLNSDKPKDLVPVTSIVSNRELELEHNSMRTCARIIIANFEPPLTYSYVIKSVP